mgnify:FL=1|tara:strand:+ start:117418 stop:117873 length:456 start_codon:yes stop_codon:yes gene_type:complete
MKLLLIVYHSQSGACAQLARSVLRGARTEEGVETCVRRAWDAGVEDLQRADGILLLAAENSGALSGGMKDLLDRTFYPANARGLVKPYAFVASAGNDGRGAVAQLQRIMSGIPFSAAVEPLILRGDVTAAHRAAAEELGSAFAAGLAMGIF